jgi:hypothetical protein
MTDSELTGEMSDDEIYGTLSIEEIRVAKFLRLME